MTSTATALTDAQIIENVLLKGDLAALTADERMQYYAATCRSVGLNALTQPFKFIVLDGELQLYALKNCTDQLRALHKISINSMTARDDGNVHVVHVQATTGDGRTDFDVGAVPLVYPAMRPGPKGMERHPLAGEFLAGLDRADAMMTAVTKAKRRVTLSLGGLGGVLDETEVAAILANGGTRDAIPVAKPAPRPVRVTPLTLVPKAPATDIFADDVPTADTPLPVAPVTAPVPPAPVAPAAPAVEAAPAEPESADASIRAALIAEIAATLDAKSSGDKVTRLHLLADHFGACWPEIETATTVDELRTGLTSLTSAPTPLATGGQPLATLPCVPGEDPAAPDSRPSVAGPHTQRIRTIEVHLGILPGQPQRTVEIPVTVGPPEPAPADAVSQALAQIDGADASSISNALKRLGANVRAAAAAKKASDAAKAAVPAPVSPVSTAGVPAAVEPSAGTIPADVTDFKKWEVDARRVNDIRTIIQIHGKSEQRITGILNGYAKMIDAMHPVHKADIDNIRDDALIALYPPNTGDASAT